MTTKTFVSGNWIGGTWSPAGDPAASDDVLLDGSSGSCVLNSLAVCRSLDCTGYTGTLSGSQSLSIGDGVAGIFKLSAGMGYTASGTLSFVSTASGNAITTAGKSIANTVVSFNGVGGSWTLQDAFATTSSIGLSNGTLDTNNQAVNVSTFTSNTATARTLTLGSSVVTISGTVNHFGNGRSPTSTNLTLNAGTSTLGFTNTSGSNCVFTGGNKTWYDLLVTTGGAGAFVIDSSNTFHAIRVTGGAAKTICFTAGTTQTITGATGLPSGVSGFLITLNSLTSGSKATLNLSGQTLSIDYVSVKDIDVTNGTLYCGTHSTDGGNNNANVIFTAPPSGSTAEQINYYHNLLMAQ